MKPNLNRANVIECRLKGIPAQIAVWGDEYLVLDRKGYAAPWLERRAGQSAVYEAIQIEREKQEDSRYD
jgi:hypothetical protein